MFHAIFSREIISSNIQEFSFRLLAHILLLSANIFMNNVDMKNVFGHILHIFDFYWNFSREKNRLFCCRLDSSQLEKIKNNFADFKNVICKMRMKFYLFYIEVGRSTHTFFPIEWYDFLPIQIFLPKWFFSLFSSKAVNSSFRYVNEMYNESTYCVSLCWQPSVCKIKQRDPKFDSESV